MVEPEPAPAPDSERVPGLRGTALAVTLAPGVFAATVAVAVRDGFPERRLAIQAARATGPRPSATPTGTARRSGPLRGAAGRRGSS